MRAVELGMDQQKTKYQNNAQFVNNASKSFSDFKLNVDIWGTCA